MTDPRSPCVIGVAQRTVRPEQGPAPEPLELWEDVCRRAALDSAGHGVLEAVDSLSIVYCLSWQYDDAPARLAQRLQLREGYRHLSGMSGTTPQELVHEAGQTIRAGRSDVAIVTGAEALQTVKSLRRQGQKRGWSHPPAERRPLPFGDPFHPAEVAHEVFQAYLTFAVFDIARRAHLGLSPDENRRRSGALFARMSEVAAANPNAWFRTRRTIDEITAVQPGNRMVAYPYTKNMVSILDVDMAAAVILASHAKADALGVPRDRRVYLRGGCYARDPVYVAERADLWRSLAMREASRELFSASGIGIDDIAHLDLYSCFGSSLSFARDALGLKDDDARSLTVTGGLPYHGGPGSNYLTHAIASLVERLRADESALGMVSGVGMHMTHHIFGLYSATPASSPPASSVAAQARVEAVPRRPIRAVADGPARIAAYSVVHGREGPARGLAICDLPDGARAYARVDPPEILSEMEATEWVGREVELVAGEREVNLVRA